MIPTYLAKKFANRFQVIEHNTLEQVCQTLNIDRAHQIAALLNEEESAKAQNAKTQLPAFTVSDK